MKKEKTLEALTELSRTILNGEYQKARHEWSGADVHFTRTRPNPSGGGFYPDPYYVVSEHALELSWLVEQLKGIFRDHIDYFNKYEFYGRLARAANHYIEQDNPDCKTLLLVTLYEAFQMLEEMKKNQFTALPVAAGNQIYHDVSDNGKHSYPEPQEVLKFFEKDQ